MRVFKRDDFPVFQGVTLFGLLREIQMSKMEITMLEVPNYFLMVFYTRYPNLRS